MTIKSYPLVLIFDQSIEYIECEEDLQESLYYLSETQTKTATCIDFEGRFSGLNGQGKAPLSYEFLTLLVQQKLAEEGQCCTAKIQITELEQVFSLMRETV
ncbi:DUF4144 domain-containing protein [Pseudoalteromonas luteoviolacea]|uniref:DUF4144 domain-containing protein n=1 Tax=Pseudoalteromonas luteoviolacea TaxID=43657 RepID=UPI001F2C0726|nr:DUF4144 domain-containing protein [Pseudoalteromonas luteoviolacea]MCF6438954.1 DUF4144 domain-containing protein [Pseudoalteromonas luteoviolacea]